MTTTELLSEWHKQAEAEENAKAVCEAAAKMRAEVSTRSAEVVQKLAQAVHERCIAGGKGAEPNEFFTGYFKYKNVLYFVTEQNRSGHAKYKVEVCGRPLVDLDANPEPPAKKGQSTPSDESPSNPRSEFT